MRIQSFMKDRLFPRHPMLYGHRGCSVMAPENTMPAFELILTQQIPGVEFDVRLCSTGEPVITHDSNLKRVTGLDAGSWFSPDFSGTCIPLPMFASRWN